MKICSNCGATNREEDGNICRKCGALLPVAKNSRRRRIEMPSNEDDEIKILSSEKLYSDNNNDIDDSIQIALRNNPEARIFHSQEKRKNNNENQFDLQEIPLSNEFSIETQQQNIIDNKDPIVTLSSQENIISEQSILKELETENGISLPEIKPQPYQGSILSSSPSLVKTSSNSSNIGRTSSLPTVKPLPTIKSSVNIENQEIKQNITKTENNVIINGNEHIISIQKQKQLDLEKDMVTVLKFLSSKLSIPKNEIKIKDKAESEIEEKIQPSSLNEILKKLLTLNNQIEAATLLKKDGTILAAAISTRISDSLLATIGQNLAMMGTDIIHGLSAGDLQSISIRGTKGILDVAPLNKDSPLLKDMLLMIFSNPKIRSGVIFFAVKQIEKLIIDFFDVK